MSALGQAYQLIRDGHQDAVVVAGLDFNVNANVAGGMEAFGALCSHEDFLEEPEEMLRPFDIDRSGTVLADGGSALVLVSDKFRREALDNERVYCEVGGFGQTCDAHHVLRPTDDGVGLQQAMLMALQDAGVDIEKGGDENCIDLINCHATSTPKGDASEAEAIRLLLQRAVKTSDQAKDPKSALITANKGHVGHMVAGAGLTESAFAIQSMVTGRVPLIRNLALGWNCKSFDDTIQEPSMNGLNYVMDTVQSDNIDIVLKNGLCFGGVNMSAVFKRCD